MPGKSMWRARDALPLRRELLDLFRRPGDGVRFGVERLRQAGDLLVRFLPVFLLDRLAHSREGFHAVAGVEAGSVDLVPVPGPARQPVAARERTLDPEQRGVEGRG